MPDYTNRTYLSLSVSSVRTVLVCCAVSLGLTLLSPDSVAKTSRSDKKKAVSLLDTGLAHQKANRHQEAVTFFDRAYELLPHAKIKYFKANSLRALYRYQEALDHYRQIQDDPKVKKYKKDIANSIRVLTRLLEPVRLAITSGDVSGAAVHIDGKPVGSTPYQTKLVRKKYTVKVVKQGYYPVEQDVDLMSDSPPQTIEVKLRRFEGELFIECNVAGATVTLDGKQVSETPLQKPVLVKPGEYLLIVSKSGHSAVQRKISVGEGSHREKVELVAGDPSATGDPTVVRRAAPRTPSVWKWVTIGLGVAIAAGGAGLQVSASQLSNDANDLSPGDFTAYDDYASEYRSKYSSAKNRMTGAYVMYAVGGAAVVGGILWLVLDRPTSRSTAAVLFPAVGRDGSVVVEAAVSF